MLRRLPAAAAAWLDARSEPTLRRLVFLSVFAFVWGMDTHGNWAGSGDVPHYEIVAQSILLDRDMDLANDYSDPTRLAGGSTLTPGLHAIAGRNGTLRPVHDVGLPILAAPYFAVCYWLAERSTSWIPPPLMARARLNPPLVLRHLLSLGMAAVASLMAALLFTICRPLLGSAAKTFLWTVAWTLSPPLVSHAFLFFTEIPSALIVAFCLRELIAPESAPRARAWVIGLAAGLLVLLHVRNVGVAAGIAAVYFWQARRRGATSGRIVQFLVALGVVLAVRTAINFTFWGTIVTSPHASPGASLGAAATAVEVFTRLFGLILDQEHGLLAYAPIYLLVLPGLFLLARTDKRTYSVICLVALAFLLPILLPMVNRHGWSGGWSPAARFLVPIAPLMIVAGCRYLGACKRLPRTAIALALIQALLDVVYWSHPKLLWNDGNGSSRLARFLSTSWFDLSGALPSWHDPTFRSVAVSIVVAVVWLAMSRRAALRRAAEAAAR